MEIWMIKQGIFWNFKIQKDNVTKISEPNLVIKIQMIYINKALEKN